MLHNEIYTLSSYYHLSLDELKKPLLPWLPIEHSQTTVMMANCQATLYHISVVKVVDVDGLPPEPLLSLLREI